MSGQLVGEVIAAADSLRARGVSERGFQALIAIAEKANTATRHASVRWDHIRAAQYGRSLATAKRAIKELEDGGYVRKIRRGFNNQQGRSAAPVYELSTMPVRADTVQTSERTPPTPNGSSMVTHSGVGERVIQGDPIATPAIDLLDAAADRMDHEIGPNGSNQGGEWVKSETEWVTQGDLLDGLTPDGSIDGAALAPDDKNSGLRDRGTSPGPGRAPALEFGRLAQQLYAGADMDRECTNCHADAHEWCRHTDGTQKRIPCVSRTRRPA